MCAKEAADRLGVLLDENFKPCWGKTARCFFGFAQAFLVCPLAFSGSFLDMSAAGLLGLFVNILHVFATEKLSFFSTVFEYVCCPMRPSALTNVSYFPRIVAVLIVSFAARGLSAISNSQYFCYQAISTAGIVSLLPGFLICTSHSFLFPSSLDDCPHISISCPGARGEAGSIRLCQVRLCYRLFPLLGTFENIEVTMP